VRVGLVLGAGGLVGAAWLTGGLEALAGETGWDPSSAEFVVGTSAGSVIGTTIAAGVPPWLMTAYFLGEDVFEGVEGVEDAWGRPVRKGERRAGSQFGLEGRLPPIGPGSWRLALSTLRSPRRHPPAALVSGWLPRGVVSTQPIKDVVRRTVPEGWTEHPNLWVVACDYATGRRTCFGRDDAPPADLADAVAASCAIPGFYHPVLIGGRRYVDGGLWSTSNLDVLRDEGLDLLICLNPTSSLHPPHAWNPLEWVAGYTRAASGRRLGSEARKLRAAGTEVVLIQPALEDLAAMGPNLMSREPRERVMRLARRTVTEQLSAPLVRELLDGLPAGDPDKVRRPSGPPSSWPAPADLAARVGPRPEAGERAGGATA